MAAIAKFISFDGGIAFSDSVVKFQKRNGDAKLFPLSEIDSIGVRRPQQENRGFIRLQTKEGKLYRIFFDDDQYSQATAFKKQLDRQLAAGPAPAEEAAAPATEPAQPEPVRRPAVRERRPAERPERKPERRPEPVEEEEEASDDENSGSVSVLRRWWFWLIVALLVIAIALAAVHLVISLRDRSASDTTVHSTAITIPVAVDDTGAGGEGAAPAESPAP